MSTIANLVISTQSSSTFSWTPTATRSSQIDATNPVYPRIIRLDNQAITLSRPGYIAALKLTDFIAALVQIVPQLTWPPLFTSSAQTLYAAPGAGGTFTVTVDSEISVTYQWQVSTNSGASYSNLTNAGVYSGTTTATLTISNGNGLNGNWYRCTATNASGATIGNSTNGSPSILYVDPLITTQPMNLTVAGSAPSAFNVVATSAKGLTLTYQWALSTDSGSTWNNLTNAGVYSGVLTANLAISASTGLTGHEYRVVVTDSNGSVTSSAATLTVT